MPALMPWDSTVRLKTYIRNHELPICHKCEQLSTNGTWVSVLAYLKKIQVVWM